MESRTKAALIGGILGTLFLGPGAGTFVGVTAAIKAHDNLARNGEDEAEDGIVP